MSQKTSPARKPSSTRVIKRNAYTTATPVKAKANDKKSTKNVKNFTTGVKTTLLSLKNRVKMPKKATRKTTKLEREAAKKHRLNVIMGIGMLLVVVSIAYSTYMTNLFVDGIAMVVALTPQVVFAVITLILAFSKIYK